MPFMEPCLLDRLLTYSHKKLVYLREKADGYLILYLCYIAFLMKHSLNKSYIMYTVILGVVVVHL